MNEAVRELLAARNGHFLLESGHHGHLLLDLDAMLWQPAAVEPLLRALSDSLAAYNVEAVVGPLVGGALLAYRVAERLALPFAYTDRVAYAADQLYSARYRLPEAFAARIRGKQVAIVDDVINAGSAVRSTAAAVRASGAEPVVIAALLRLGETALGQQSPTTVPITTLASWPNALWKPPECPLCSAGVPLEQPIVSSA
ncbi:phosphoribosyltransferase family protein [Micromonospora zamorensis]|uniref:orotate phosphoribosyltransferase n=1 Tax=Micromonospora zamorensis TaxID=709883 RepID=UPI0033DA769C